MSVKSIEVVVSPPGHHFVGDGFRVHNFIPGVPQLSMERMSPFLMLDYNSKFVFPPSEKPKGVGVHPHKGFETVTIAYKGKVAHGDSYGNHGVIKEGDVQWMTAASGLLHKEYHEESFSKTGGEFQMVQLWVNLPAKFKLSEPKYQGIENKEINKYVLDDNSGVIEVIAGNFKDVKGTAFTFTPIHMYNVKLNKAGQQEFTLPSHYNTCALVIEGSIIVNGSTKVSTDNLVLFKNDGENFTIEASENSIVLVLSGEPIFEPIAAHGPFVMNTRAELIEAFEEFNSGKFGKLEE